MWSEHLPRTLSHRLREVFKIELSLLRNHFNILHKVCVASGDGMVVYTAKTKRYTRTARYNLRAHNNNNTKTQTDTRIICGADTNKV